MLGPSGAAFTAGGIEIETPLRGRFNVENVLGVVAAAILLDVDEDGIAAGIAALAGVPGRFEAVDAGQPFTVVVDYAHKPDALDNVLRPARELTDGRVVLVFGAGGDRDRGKRPLMGKVARTLADVVIVTSDNPRSEDPLAIIQDVLQGAGTDVEIDPDRRSAIGRALGLAEPGDVVVIAGKGHEQGQEIAGEKLPFDDRDRRPARRCGRDPDPLEELEALGLGLGRARRHRRAGRDHRPPDRLAPHRPGDLFVAIGGGGAFVDDARDAGRVDARADDHEDAMAVIGQLLVARSRARFVGVTGSTGKTSTKDILGALCSPVVPTSVAEGSFNAELGVPLTLGRLEPETEICIVEMGMRGIGQIADSARSCGPTSA